MRNVTWGLLVLALLTLWGATLSAEPLAVSADRDRIRAHLLEVEAELLAADVSHLSEAQRAARGENIETLRAYRIRGEFPHNTYQAGRTPVFIDADGRACAVGHLMIESGWDHAARAISGRENLARLPNMKSPEVTEWLKVSGLTAAEATRIQPGYSGVFCGQNCPCENDGSNDDRSVWPVCGSDGNSYLNSCVAQACAGITEFTYGCCNFSDTTIGTPDLDMGSGDDGCGGLWDPQTPVRVCRSERGMPPQDMGSIVGDDNSDSDMGPGDDGGCATAGGSPGVLGLVALVLFRRRRWPA